MKYDHFGTQPSLRIVTDVPDWPESGPGWTCVSSDMAAQGADILLLQADSEANRRLIALGLPLVVMGGDASPAALVDQALAFVLPGDPPDVVAGVLADVMAGVMARSPAGVREWNDNTPNISALSLEAGRIAAALARLAAAEPQREGLVSVDAALLRRIIRLRRDRERFFPAEIFADPAWDMLLDLLAAQMENRQVAVSSLCIAACVPTTTALRWIRSLSEAGVFERTIDPNDARRTYISLSASSVEGMMAWLRRFAEVFAPRG
jgi:hypothetical protein